MSKKWEEENNVLEVNNIAFRKLPDPENTKVYLFGKELTNGKDWKDFMERGLELQQENKELKNRVADLEAKLAESEKENRDLEDNHNKLIDQYNKQYNELCKEINVHSSARERFVKKVKELEQQLAEKEKEIEKYKELCTISKLEDLQIENMLLKGKAQDKISFCIEQLEKVKEFVKENESWKIEGSDYSIVYADDVLDQIDNQIEELKKGENK